MANVSCSGNSDSHSFQRIAAAFLSQPGLPFANVLSANRIERIFAKHGSLFGVGTIYSTAVMVWSFLGQVLRDGKEASCQSAVARVVTHCQQQGVPSPTHDTGDYCRARAKLSEAALRDLTREVAAEVEEQAQPNWLWKGRHAKLIDGFTFTMPDTPKNQLAYPRQKSQMPGVGFPIARAVAIVSLATACVLDLAVGPYQGKETGETGLLRSILKAFLPEDVAVTDRYYCSFMMIALFHAQRTHVCARMHQRRYRSGKDRISLSHIVIPDRRLRSRQPPRPTGAARPQTPPPRLQTHARAPTHPSSETTQQSERQVLKELTGDSAIRS